MAELKVRAVQEALPPLTLPQLDAALCTFDDSTSTAWDGDGPRFIKNLPKQGRQEC